jgi:hypothetical protein
MKTFLLKIFTSICFLSIVYTFSSYSGGANGQAANGCGAAGSCHGVQSNLTDLFFTGLPSTGYIPGNTYTITATVKNIYKTAAGFNITSNNGAFTSGTQQQISGIKDISHTQAKAMNAANESIFDIVWTADTLATTTFIFAGNAVDATGSNANDAWAKLPFTFYIDANAASLKPSIISKNVNSITGTNATINATINSNTFSTNALVKYGTTKTLANSLSMMPSGFTTISTCTVNLSGLSPNTKYYYSINAANAMGNISATIDSFTTDFATTINQLNNEIKIFQIGNNIITNTLVAKIELYTLDGKLITAAYNCASLKLENNYPNICIIKVSNNKTYSSRIVYNTY